MYDLSADSMKILDSAIPNTPYYLIPTTIANSITLSSIMENGVADSDDKLKINIKKNQIKFNFNL